MGEIIFSNFEYIYVDGNYSETIFDYKDCWKNLSRAPLHTDTNSIDSILKKSHAQLSSILGSSNENLLWSFFLVQLLIIRKCMTTRLPIKEFTVGSDLYGLHEILTGNLFLLNPLSQFGFVGSTNELPPNDPIDIIVLSAFNLSSMDSLIDNAMANLNKDGRIIIMTNSKATVSDKYNSKQYNIDSFTIFCIDKHKSGINQIATFAPISEPISNFELVKDFGIVPYLFYKNHGCKTYFVGCTKERYPFEHYIHGIELVQLESVNIENKLTWLRNHASDLDLLMLFGTYPDNMSLAAEYTALNPTGKIYLALDASDYWIDHIPRYEKRYEDFYNNCNLISVTTPKLKNYIYAKWNINTEVVRCGYYDFDHGLTACLEFDSKENYIITCGRIGAKEKRNDILVESFIKIHKQLPDWKLKLIGPVQDDFKNYIEDVSQKYPELKSRIILTGIITDKRILHEHFMSAKVFALTSESEGFPNVIPEAMSAGLSIVTSKVSNSEDFVVGGKIGSIFAVNDVDDCAKKLLDICSSQKNLRQISKLAYSNYLLNYDYISITDHLYKQLCD